MSAASICRVDEDSKKVVGRNFFDTGLGFQDGCQYGIFRTRNKESINILGIQDVEDAGRHITRLACILRHEYLPWKKKGSRLVVSTTFEIDGIKVTVVIDIGDGFTIFSEKEWMDRGTRN